MFGGWQASFSHLRRWFHFETSGSTLEMQPTRVCFPHRGFVLDMFWICFGYVHPWEDWSAQSGLLVYDQHLRGEKVPEGPKEHIPHVY